MWARHMEAGSAASQGEQWILAMPGESQRRGHGLAHRSGMVALPEAVACGRVSEVAKRGCRGVRRVKRMLLATVPLRSLCARDAMHDVSAPRTRCCELAF